jgi:hypothetical protein
MSFTKKQQLEKESLLTAEKVKSLLHYDPNTGDFTWLCDPHTGPRRKGSIAGVIGNFGYRLIKISQKRYLAHRLAWLMVHGSWPEFDVDHINGDRGDNRIENLRAATRAENCANRRLESFGVSGAKGVFWNKKLEKWQVGLKKGKLRKHVGLFSDLNEAKAAYVREAEKFFGQFARKPT